tara:strand:+ start:49 stop:456 length:408 start_codon:yes stop_codon:yes gene_type:complete
MEPVELLLSRLEHVRANRNGTWVARCPAHDDRSPSLSITTGDDGKVLLHCFAGCGAADVVESIGLELSSLFPETHDWKGRRRTNVDYKALCHFLQHEITVLIIAAEKVKSGEALNEDDQETLARVQKSLERLNNV